MNTFIIIFLSIIFYSILLLILFGICKYMKNKHLMNIGSIPKQSSPYEITRKEVYFFIGIVLIIFSFPFFLTWEKISFINFTDTGNIGDTIGGITAPFLSVLGSILVYLAFKEQIKANKLVQDQFQLQQFENQFFEMLHLHRENLNELNINLSPYNKYFTINNKIIGREAIKTIVLEINYLLDHLKKVNNNINDNFQDCFDIVFFGTKKNPPFTQKYDINNLNMKYDNTVKYSSFSGFSSILGHYFRHLFLTVHFIVNNEVFSSYSHLNAYVLKMKYLKLLRVQLSSFEQMLLFYNWLGGDLGSSWEDANNDFFTTYSLIHNIHLDNIFMSSFIYENLNRLIDKYNMNNFEDPLFEFKGLNKTYKLLSS